MKLARSILMAGSLALLATEAGAQVITSYTYDSIGRLTKSASTTGKTAKYSYDLADNRTDKVDATTTFIGPGAGHGRNIPGTLGFAMGIVSPYFSRSTSP